MSAKAKGFNFGWLWIVGLLAVLLLFKAIGAGVQSRAVESLVPSAPSNAIAEKDDAWITAITAWEQENAEFLSDPWRRSVMEAALEQFENIVPGLSNEALIHEAELIAFDHAAWDPGAQRNPNPFAKYANDTPPSNLIPQSELDRVSADMEREQQVRRDARILADELQR